LFTLEEHSVDGPGFAYSFVASEENLKNEE
jgi:hypothetical protein